MGEGDFEVIGDDYIIKTYGFSKKWIDNNAGRIGSLKTRPRKFIKQDVENYIKNLAQQNREKYIRSQNAGRDVVNRLDKELRSFRDRKRIKDKD